MRPRTLSLIVIVLAAAVAALAPAKPIDLPGGFDSPIVAMYMSTSLAAVQWLVNPTTGATVTRWTMFLAVDFGFAIAYGLLFFRLARQLGARPGALPKVAAAIGAACALGAAAADIGENIWILLALHGSATAASAITPTSLTKWALLGVTALAMSVRFFRRGPIDSEAKLLELAGSFFYLCTAVIVGFALFDHLILEQVTRALGAAVLMHTVAMLMDGRIEKIL